MNTNCPWELPIPMWRPGHFCERGEECRFPNCKVIDPAMLEGNGPQNANIELSDSPQPDGVSGDSYTERGRSSGDIDKDSSELSYSSRPARVWQTVTPYHNKGREYFRYQWGIGGEVKETIHIPGGARTNPVALKRAREVWVGIHKRGWSVEQTKAFISPWRGHRARL